MLHFEKLSFENIDAATKLVHSVFPEDARADRKPGDAYRASLEPEKYADFYKRLNYKVTLLEYYVAKEEGGSQVVGVTGFYQRDIDEKNVVWLGWFCVDPKFRGKGYGQGILEWSINKAREKRFILLRLWTTTDPNEAAAQGLSDKLGFNIYNREKDESDDYETLYREKKL